MVLSNPQTAVVGITEVVRTQFCSRISFTSTKCISFITGARVIFVSALIVDLLLNFVLGCAKIAISYFSNGEECIYPVLHPGKSPTAPYLVVSQLCVCQTRPWRERRCTNCTNKYPFEYIQPVVFVHASTNSQNGCPRPKPAISLASSFIMSKSLQYMLIGYFDMINPQFTQFEKY